MKKPKDYIIFPLDFSNRREALSYVDLLRDHVGIFKVGLELFIAQGPEILKEIHNLTEAGIFLDLKLHDIPATVKRAFLAASAYQPHFVTVHCDEGERGAQGCGPNQSGKHQNTGDHRPHKPGPE